MDEIRDTGLVSESVEEVATSVENPIPVEVIDSKSEPVTSDPDDGILAVTQDLGGLASEAPPTTVSYDGGNFTPFGDIIPPGFEDIG